jgi:hypothetical protein
MKSKFGPALEHTPEASAAKVKVVVNPLPEQGEVIADDEPKAKTKK